MNIRSVTSDDVQTLQNLNDEIFIDNAKYDKDIKIDWAQSELGKKYFTKVVNKSESICLIAEENGKPIGYINASPLEFDYRYKKYIEVNNMGVSPLHRSKGIGAKLMAKCLKIAKERGFNAVYVISYCGNVKAVAFYEKNGFKRIDLGLERDL